MLEKIGLPPKPSLRGNTWVVDASHCQGCASLFTFINRKHHCRRCGGIFCGSCTQQRMLLRGQGDSPVRICDPCKKLEEAARFELRHGHKNKAVRGDSKFASRKEDEDEVKIVSKKITSSASSSNRQQSISHIEEHIAGDLSLDWPTNSSADVESATPEELRDQAILEKKRYKTLKAEGKSEEALRAFKRGKELERQADALEISLRKLRKRALSTSNLDDAQPVKEHLRSSGKNKLNTEKSKGKDDLSAELRELGWSDPDLHDAEKRPATLTVEGELSSLLREVSQKPGKEKQHINPDKSLVMAHKKKALELKRAGNLTAAKEELKQAKILERKIEEEELLGGSDDSDDELSSLMRSVDSDEHAKLSSRYELDIGFDFNQFVGIGDDLGADDNFEVTNEDMEDPEIASALKSFGWDEDASDSEDVHDPDSTSSQESLLYEIQNLKREAINQKRAGNASEALALLRKAKVLEKEIMASETQDSNLRAKVSTAVQRTSVAQSVGDNFSGHKSSSKSKLTIQKELIAVKKRALNLRREGKLDESEEELRTAKVLEQQLEEMNATPVVAPLSTHVGKASTIHTAFDDDDDEEVTDQDLNDPSYLSLLENLGWQDEEPKENEKTWSILPKENIDTSFAAQSTLHLEAGTSRKSKSKIQRELLALKRKALTLRRRGEVEAADEVLNNARLLEVQLQEYDEQTQRFISYENSKGNASVDVVQQTDPSLEVERNEIGTGDLLKQDKVTSKKPEETLGGNDSDKSHEHRLSFSRAAVDSQPHSRPQQAGKKLDDHESNSSPATVSEAKITTPQQILAHKRKAVSLKREGKLAEAKEELRLAKLLEKQAEEDKIQTSIKSVPMPVLDVSSSSAPKLLSSRERFKLQQESLGHKRQALKLRREGKTAEADAEFELAKAIEAQLQEVDETAVGPPNTVEADDANVEDFLDPQLLSALLSLGIETTQVTPGNQGIERSATAKSNASNASDAEIERKQLTEQIKVEKVKALNLKRAGNQAEALDALRQAKLYEKKLQSLNPN